MTNTMLRASSRAFGSQNQGGGRKSSLGKNLLMCKQDKIKINAGGREGVGRFTGLPLWIGWVGREAICLLFFPLLLHLAFVFPGIAVGTQGFVD
jgi:hypothetical protein